MTFLQLGHRWVASAHPISFPIIKRTIAQVIQLSQKHKQQLPILQLASTFVFTFLWQNGHSTLCGKVPHWFITVFGIIWILEGVIWFINIGKVSKWFSFWLVCSFNSIFCWFIGYGFIFDILVIREESE